MPRSGGRTGPHRGLSRRETQSWAERVWRGKGRAGAPPDLPPAGLGEGPGGCGRPCTEVTCSHQRQVELPTLPLCRTGGLGTATENLGTPRSLSQVHPSPSRPRATQPAVSPLGWGLQQQMLRSAGRGRVCVLAPQSPLQPDPRTRQGAHAPLPLPRLQRRTRQCSHPPAGGARSRSPSRRLCLWRRCVHLSPRVSRRAGEEPHTCVSSHLRVSSGVFPRVCKQCVCAHGPVHTRVGTYPAGARPLHPRPAVT